MIVTKALSSNHYYGMLTIKGTRGSKLVLGIPNNNVRKQYYGFWRKNIRQYAAAPRVEALRQGTTLHKIIMQFEDIKKPLDFDEKV